jgi:hypothetical protein
VQLSGCKSVRTRLGAGVDQGDKRGIMLPEGSDYLPHRIFRSDVQKGTSKGSPLVMDLVGVKLLAHPKDVFKGDDICSSSSSAFGEEMQRAKL